jgi:hypothetical protein
MHMIFLPSKLDEVAAPGRQAIPKRLSQILQQIWRECFAPIFGHKHAMQLKVKYCMRTRDRLIKWLAPEYKLSKNFCDSKS